MTSTRIKSYCSHCDHATYKYVALAKVDKVK